MSKSLLHLQSIKCRVWVTVDKKLYLWNYCAPNEDVIVYDGISEVIVAVCLCTPKAGIFIDSIRYLLVVASTVEVSLIAVSCDDQGQDLKLLPTAYVMPSDSVTMVKVVGSQQGRVFMAGDDNNVYELEYGNAQGAWTSLLGVGGETRHKCRKVNHFAWNWKLVHMLPPFLRSVAGEEDELVDLIVDNIRCICYAITRRGLLSALFLGAEGGDSQLFLNAMSVLDAARSHLRYCRNDSSPKVENFTNSATAGFEVSSMHTIPLTESKKVHLVLILRNSIRIYLSLIVSEGQGSPPVDMKVVYVRSPPPVAAIKSAVHSKPGFSRVADAERHASALDPVVPQFLPGQSPEMGPTLYSDGVVLGAVSRPQRPDEVVCVFEDLVGRASLSLGFAPVYQQPSLREGLCVPIDERENSGRIYDMKESCSPLKAPGVAAVASLFAQSHVPHSNAAIKDDTLIPWGGAGHTHRRSKGVGSGWFPSGESEQVDAAPPVPLWSGSTFLAMHGGGGCCSADIYSAGYERSNLRSVALLGQMSWQHAPASSASFRRHFLVLTNQGVHVLQKLRPADVLHRHISRIQENSDELCRDFFSYFGDLQASAMCIALACGLPSDAGATPSLSDVLSSSGSSSAMNSIAAVGVPLDMIQTRAMNLVLGMTQAARFAGTGSRPGGAPGGRSVHQDSRLVLSGSDHQFVHSTAHDALHLLTSRILRAIWLRPIARSDCKGIFPAWPLLIAQVRPPLYQLQKIIRGFFTAAVMSDPRQVDFISALTNNFSEDLLTQQVLRRTQSVASADKMLLQLAKSVEDASLNALYRVVTRALQALSLLEVLSTIQKRGNLSISWKSCDSLSFRSLVLSVKAHEAMKKLINGALEQYRNEGDMRSADKMIAWLTSECYHYFSVGDRCAFEALSIVDQVNTTLQSADEISEQQLHASKASTARCITLLLRAAHFWGSYEAVSGDNSHLSRFCASLLRLGRAGRLGIVDLCLVAAANFVAAEDRSARGPSEGAAARPVNRRIASLRSATDLNVDDADSVADQLHWEQLMYHGPTAKTDAEIKSCVVACYACLVESVMTAGTTHSNLGVGVLDFDDFVPGDSLYRARALSSEEARARAVQNMKEMAIRALESCADPVFHELLCERLLLEHSELLLAISSPHVESFLLEKDVDLAYR